MAAPITPITPLPFFSFSVGLTDAAVVELDPQPFSNTKEVVLLNLSQDGAMYVAVADLGSTPASGDIDINGVANPGDQIDIGAATLTAVAGPPGVDEVSIDGVLTATQFAGRVYRALIDPANSFLAQNVSIYVVDWDQTLLNAEGILEPSPGSPIRVVSTLVGAAGNATTFSDTGADWATFAPAGQTSSSPGTLDGGVDAGATLTAANSTVIPACGAITLSIGSEGNRQPLGTSAFWAANPGSKLGIVATMAPGAAPADLNVTYVQNRGYWEGV